MTYSLDDFETILADVASEASENLDARLDAVDVQYTPAGFKYIRKALYSEAGVRFWIVKHLAKSQVPTMQSFYEKRSLEELKPLIRDLNMWISQMIPEDRAEFHKPWSEASEKTVNQWANTLHKVGDQLHRTAGPAVEDGPAPYQWYWVNGHVLGNAVGSRRVDMIRAWDYSVRYDLGPALASALVSQDLADFQKRVTLFAILVIFGHNS